MTAGTGSKSAVNMMSAVLTDPVRSPLFSDPAACI